MKEGRIVRRHCIICGYICVTAVFDVKRDRGEVRR